MDGFYDYISFVICVATLFFNVLLNGGIIIASCIDRVLRQKRFVVLISLAVADLLKIIPLISEIGISWHHLTSCLSIASMGFYLICVTILHLVLESINRLVAIARPLKYNDLLTRNLFVLLMFAVWFLPILGIILPHAVYTHPTDWLPSFRLLMFNCDPCSDTSPINNSTKPINANERPVHSKPVNSSVTIYSAIITVIYFLIPLITMILSYSFIFNISLKHIRQIRTMEKNMRQLYHRFSQSKLASTQGSELRMSTRSSVTTTESLVIQPVPHCIDTKRSELSWVENSADNKIQYETDVKYKKIDENSHGKQSNSSLPIDCFTYGLDSEILPETISNKCIIFDKSKNQDENPTGTDYNENNTKYSNMKRKISTLSDENTLKKTKTNKNRKVSNIVYPQDDIASTTRVPVEQLKAEYMSMDLSNESKNANEVISIENRNCDNDSKSTPKRRRQSVVPLKAADIMASEDESTATGEIPYIFQRESDDLKMKDKETLTIEFGSSTSSIVSGGTVGRSTTQIMNASDDVFLQDFDEKNMIKTIQHSANLDLRETSKRQAWPKLWKVAKKTDKMDSIPSEDAFMKIIDELERKSKPPRKRFAENTRRLMRFSVLLRSSRRKSSLEEDEDTNERPTQEEVDRLESLISFAESRPVEQMAKELNKTNDDNETQNQQETVDIFSLMTGFPVMEAWANSLKAKAMPQSNSFVRFYRVIRGEMRNRKKEGKLVKTLGILFTAWIVFYVPIIAFSWKRLMSWPLIANNNYGTGRFLISWALLSSAINPIIYCLRIPEFKKAFNKIRKNLKLYFCYQ